MGTEKEPLVNKCISLPEEMLEEAMKRAEAQHRNFSNYVLSLIAEDVRRMEQEREQTAA